MRRLLTAQGLLLAATVGCGTGRSGAADNPWPLTPRDPVKLQLMLQLVVTCSDPETVGGQSGDSKDGRRTEIWPIIGGRFEGRGIQGTVVAGGGDFPVMRPDGVEVVDALYRLKTDDGVTIIIHNKGLAYPQGKGAGDWHYRLAPEFIAPRGKYEWLNSHLFISTLSEVPAGMQQAQGAKQNDRLIQVYEVE